MSSADNFNFRGKFRQYDTNGTPYLYRIGDVVEYKGAQYVAISPTSTSVPNASSSEEIWRSLEAAAGGSFYIQDTPPDESITEGDRWYRPDISVMYTRIKQDLDLIWVEL